MKNTLANSEIAEVELTAIESGQEPALNASEEKYRELLEFAADAFIQGDVEGNIMTVNYKATELTGFSRSELLSMKIVDLFPPQISDQILLTGEPPQPSHTLITEREITRKDGQVIQVEMNSRISNKGFSQCFAREVTQRRRAEVALRENEEKLRVLLDESSDPIFTFHPDGQYRYVNKAFADGVGRKLEEIIGRRIWDVFSQEEADKRFAAIKWVFAHGAEKVIEVRVPTSCGDRWYITTVKPIINEQGQVMTVICISKEITARKQTEQALLESEARLSKLNATKDKFFSILGHDLKSPFNSIMGFSNLLAEQVQNKNFHDIEKYTAIIQNSSKRALALLRNLLEWSRSQTGNMVFTPENIEIVDLMEEVTEQLKDAAQQKSITIVKILPPSDLVFADKEMICSTLRNLVSNAIKFTHHGGEISLSAKKNQDEWIISISDNGTGIHPEALEKLFHIDQTHSTVGTENERGTGLGLILCQEFVEKHGGKIWMESELDKGSKVSFTIPLAPTLPLFRDAP